MAEFNKNILEWVNCDNKIKTNNEVVKELRLKKDSLETNIIGYIQENNLEGNIFNISSSVKLLTLLFLEIFNFVQISFENFFPTP